MDTKRFSCALMCPALFPAYIRNPPKIKVVAEVDSDKIAFVSSPPGGQARTIAGELIGNVSKVIIQHLSVNSQRLEVLRKSLFRIPVVAAALFIYFMLQSRLAPSRDLVYYILIALVAAACVSGPLFFLLNGGLTIKNDAVRFHFTPLKKGKPFYLEVEPAQELEIRQAFLSAGLKLEENLSK